jgi:hypothetical protein
VILIGSEEPACNFKGDTLLATNVALRQGLLKALRASSWMEAEPLRREQAGALVRRSDGSFEAVPILPDSASNCGVFLNEANKAFMAADSVLAVYHSHPYRPGRSLTWTKDGKTETETYDPPLRNLNSDSDALLTAAITAKRQDAGRAPIDFYYVDTQNVYRMPASSNHCKALSLEDGSIVKHENCRF